VGRAGGGGLWVVGERAVVSDEETSREREQERIAVLRGTGTIVYVLYCIDEVSNIHMRRGWSRWRDCVSARNRHCSSWRDFIPPKRPLLRAARQLLACLPQALGTVTRISCNVC